MAPTRNSPRADERARLLDVALRTVEEAGPEALQARRLAAEIGSSTQAIYTLFGGMPALFEAMVADGFARFARHVQSVPETEDPVADFFAQGWAYCDWALTYPQLYRLMFGLSGGLRLRIGLDMTAAGTLANFPEGHAAIDVMVRSLDRVEHAGRIRPVESVVVARQFLSATHGYVLLASAGTFGEHTHDVEVLGPLAINLMVGLGDSREAVERSAFATLAGRSEAREVPARSEARDPVSR
jgi:AcrR family transcriptional regulator